MADTLTDIYDRLRRRVPRPARLLAVVALVLAVSSCGLDKTQQENTRGEPADSWTWTNVAGVQTACLDNGDRLYGYQGSITVAPGGCRS